jgi:hypothetical protein
LNNFSLQPPFKRILTMRLTTTLVLIASSVLLSLPAYAINVKVVSTNSDIQGLGFTVNGKENGGMGTEYHKAGLPKGSYSFGVRMNGKDISCKDGHGKKMIRLNSDTNAVLNLKGNRCKVTISST